MSPRKDKFSAQYFHSKMFDLNFNGIPPPPLIEGDVIPPSHLSRFSSSHSFLTPVAFSRQLADVPSPPVLIPVSGGSRDGQCARNQNFINLESGSLEIARHGFLDAKDVLLCV